MGPAVLTCSTALILQSLNAGGTEEVGPVVLTCSVALIPQSLNAGGAEEVGTGALTCSTALILHCLSAGGTEEVGPGVLTCSVALILQSLNAGGTEEVGPGCVRVFYPVDYSVTEMLFRVTRRKVSLSWWLRVLTPLLSNQCSGFRSYIATAVAVSVWCGLYLSYRS